MVNAGWLAVYGKEAAIRRYADARAREPNETVKTEKIEVEANVTKHRRVIRKRRCLARWKAREINR